VSSRRLNGSRLSCGALKKKFLPLITRAASFRYMEDMPKARQSKARGEQEGRYKWQGEDTSNDNRWPRWPRPLIDAYGTEHEKDQPKDQKTRPVHMERKAGRPQAGVREMPKGARRRRSTVMKAVPAAHDQPPNARSAEDVEDGEAYPSRHYDDGRTPER